MGQVMSKDEITDLMNYAVRVGTMRADARMNDREGLCVDCGNIFPDWHMECDCEDGELDYEPYP